MIYRQDISSIASVIGLNGHHFKVLHLSEDAKAVFRGKGANGVSAWSLRTDIKAGLTLDLSSYGTPVTEIEFTSYNAQNIRFWCGKAKAEDSSLSGAVGVDSANRVVYNPVKTIVAITEIYPENIVRQSGTFHISAPCYVNDTINGIILAAGLHQWTNKQALNLIPVSGSVDVRSMDELF